MDNFQRMIKSAIARRIAYVLVGIVFALIADFARADYTAPKTYFVNIAPYNSTNFPSVPTSLEACQSFVVWYDGFLTTGTATYISSNENTCTYKLSTSGSNTNSNISWYKDCSDGLGIRAWNSAPGGTNGNCLGDPPPPPPSCEDSQGSTIGPVGFYSNQVTKSLACIEGCHYAKQNQTPPVLDCTYGSGIGTCAYTYEVTYISIGSECEPENPIDTPEPPPAQQPDCPACRCMESGGSFGQVNGVDTCVPLGSSGSTPVTKPSTPPVTTTTTPAPTPENPNPEPVTEVTPAPIITVTPPPAGSPAGTPPTVTETTTDSEGGTVTVDKDKKSFCQENPTAQICREDDDSIFGGSCGSYRCEGDAIQCAIALKQHQTACQMVEQDAVSELGSDIIEGQTLTENPLGESETFDLGSLDTTATMSKADLSDLSFSVGGHSLVMPLSSLNDGLRFAGLIVLAFAYVAAARIIFS